MSIGEKIKQYANLKKISLRRLANECEINYNTLYAMVSRKSNNIPLHYIEKIAKSLGIPVEALTDIDSPVKESRLSEAELRLETTISAIIGFSEGEERENKLYMINSFLEANSDLIKSVVKAIENNKGE